MTNGQTMHTLPGSSQFPTTRWTLVIAAGDPRRKEARSALVSLCENYWYPLYAYLRRHGYPADQAQDLTQEFFSGPSARQRSHTLLFLVRVHPWPKPLLFEASRAAARQAFGLDKRLAHANELT